MKLIEPKVELIQQQPGLVGMYKHIERCARTCYKSEDKITEDSYKKMYDNLVQRGHLAMFEHGTVYLKIPDVWSPLLSLSFKEEFGQFSKVFMVCNDLYITTNLRVIIENKLEKYLKYLCEPTKFHERRITLKFTSDIQFYKDLTRHREESYAIESTRWCNYMAKKFGMSISFFHPQWLKEEDKEEFENDCKFVENLYFKWKDKGWTTEQAAYFLIQGTAATVIVTGFTSGFKHIFDLRLNGTTGKPHETMLQLMGMAKEELIKNNLWNLIYPENERS